MLFILGAGTRHQSTIRCKKKKRENNKTQDVRIRYEEEEEYEKEEEVCKIREKKTGQKRTR